MKFPRSIKFILPFVLTAAVFAPPVMPVQAQEGEAASREARFQGYVQLLSARARGEGVSEATIGRMTSGLSFNPRVIELDRGQPGSGNGVPPPMSGYLRRHVDAQRIGRGRAQFATLGPLGSELERSYGVPAQVLLAIWGHETNYGGYTGDFDLARSLATLAYEGRRRELFSSEFVALLKVADRGVPRERLTGSWAGAFGNPQFLPSVYLRLARDGDGDGKTDLWGSRADTLASIANYFRDAGWRSGQPWGARVYLPDGFDRTGVATRLEAPSCPGVHERHSQWRTVAEWRAQGLMPQSAIADSVMATLFQPDGPGTPAFLLTGNYRVILQYNCSNYYALSVGLLADEIAR